MKRVKDSADTHRIRHATDLDIISCGGEGGLPKNERNFVGGVWASESVAYFMDGP